MLSLALAATLVGFGLLVFALMMTSLPLAIVCVAVCVVGLILLVVDTLRANKRGRGEDDEPLFTIRGRASAAREEPLENEPDDVAAASVEPPDAAVDAEADDAPTAAYGDQTASTWSIDGGPTVRDQEPPSGGLGSLVAPTSEHIADSARTAGSGGFTPLSGGFAAAAREGAEPHGAEPRGTEPRSAEPRGGDVNDYLRSTGSFPAQQSATQAAQTPMRPTGTSPIGTSPTGAPRTGESGRGAPEGAGAESADVGEVSAGQAAAEAAMTGQEPAPYVGRRRLGGDPIDDIVVRPANPDLPAMQFVWEDPDAQPKGDAPG